MGGSEQQEGCGVVDDVEAADARESNATSSKPQPTAPLANTRSGIHVLSTLIGQAMELKRLEMEYLDVAPTLVAWIASTQKSLDAVIVEPDEKSIKQALSGHLAAYLHIQKPGALSKLNTLQTTYGRIRILRNAMRKPLFAPRNQALHLTAIHSAWDMLAKTESDLMARVASAQETLRDASRRIDRFKVQAAQFARFLSRMKDNVISRATTNLMLHHGARSLATNCSSHPDDASGQRELASLPTLPVLEKAMETLTKRRKAFDVAYTSIVAMKTPCPRLYDKVAQQASSLSSAFAEAHDQLSYALTQATLMQEPLALLTAIERVSPDLDAMQRLVDTALGAPSSTLSPPPSSSRTSSSSPVPVPVPYQTTTPHLSDEYKQQLLNQLTDAAESLDKIRIDAEAAAAKSPDVSRFIAPVTAQISVKMALIKTLRSMIRSAASQYHVAQATASIHDEALSEVASLLAALASLRDSVFHPLSSLCGLSLQETQGAISLHAAVLLLSQTLSAVSMHQLQAADLATSVSALHVSMRTIPGTAPVSIASLVRTAAHLSSQYSAQVHLARRWCAAAKKVLASAGVLQQAHVRAAELQQRVSHITSSFEGLPVLLDPSTPARPLVQSCATLIAQAKAASSEAMTLSSLLTTSHSSVAGSLRVLVDLSQPPQALVDDPTREETNSSNGAHGAPLDTVPLSVCSRLSISEAEATLLSSLHINPFVCDIPPAMSDTAQSCFTQDRDVVASSLTVLSQLQESMKKALSVAHGAATVEDFITSLKMYLQQRSGISAVVPAKLAVGVHKACELHWEQIRTAIPEAVAEDQTVRSRIASAQELLASLQARELSIHTALSLSHPVSAVRSSLSNVGKPPALTAADCAGPYHHLQRSRADAVLVALSSLQDKLTRADASIASATALEGSERSQLQADATALRASIEDHQAAWKAFRDTMHGRQQASTEQRMIGAIRSLLQHTEIHFQEKRQEAIDAVNSCGLEHALDTARAMLSQVREMVTALEANHAFEHEDGALDGGHGSNQRDLLSEIAAVEEQVSACDAHLPRALAERSTLQRTLSSLLSRVRMLDANGIPPTHVSSAEQVQLQLSYCSYALDEIDVVSAETQALATRCAESDTALESTSLSAVPLTATDLEELQHVVSSASCALTLRQAHYRFRLQLLELTKDATASIVRLDGPKKVSLQDAQASVEQLKERLSSLSAEISDHYSAAAAETPDADDAQIALELQALLFSIRDEIYDTIRTCEKLIAARAEQHKEDTALHEFEVAQSRALADHRSIYSDLGIIRREVTSLSVFREAATGSMLKRTSAHVAQLETHLRDVLARQKSSPLSKTAVQSDAEVELSTLASQKELIGTLLSYDTFRVSAMALLAWLQGIHTRAMRLSASSASWGDAATEATETTSATSDAVSGSLGSLSLPGVSQDMTKVHALQTALHERKSEYEELLNVAVSFVAAEDEHAPEGEDADPADDSSSATAEKGPAKCSRAQETNAILSLTDAASLSQRLMRVWKRLHELLDRRMRVLERRKKAASVLAFVEEIETALEVVWAQVGGRDDSSLVPGEHEAAMAARECAAARSELDGLRDRLCARLMSEYDAADVAALEEVATAPDELVDRVGATLARMDALEEEVDLRIEQMERAQHYAAAARELVSTGLWMNSIQEAVHDLRMRLEASLTESTDEGILDRCETLRDKVTAHRANSDWLQNRSLAPPTSAAERIYAGVDAVLAQLDGVKAAATQAHAIHSAVWEATSAEERIAQLMLQLHAISDMSLSTGVDIQSHWNRTEAQYAELCDHVATTVQKLQSVAKGADGAAGPTTALLGHLQRECTRHQHVLEKGAARLKSVHEEAKAHTASIAEWRETAAKRNDLEVSVAALERELLHQETKVGAWCEMEQQARQVSSGVYGARSDAKVTASLSLLCDSLEDTLPVLHKTSANIDGQHRALQARVASLVSSFKGKHQSDLQLFIDRCNMQLRIDQAVEHLEQLHTMHSKLHSMLMRTQDIDKLDDWMRAQTSSASTGDAASVIDDFDRLCNAVSDQRTFEALLAQQQQQLGSFNSAI